MLCSGYRAGICGGRSYCDIEGLDAGRKVAILASVAFNSRVVFNDVYTEGIAKITSKDIHYAKEMGRAIKLLGVARNTEDGIEAYVCPMLFQALILLLQ